MDNNHVGAWANEHPMFMERFNRLPGDTPIRVSTITIGEMECGHLITTTTNLVQREKHKRFLTTQIIPYNALPITATTRVTYAEILHRILTNHRKPPSKRTEAFLVESGVDINDVWSVALAMEHGLTFLTTDRMAYVKEAAEEVTFENWLV